MLTVPPTTKLWFAGGVALRLGFDGLANQVRGRLAGRVITADAMFTHRDVCDTITHAGGDYLLAVKDNQPLLEAANATEFADEANRSPCEQRRLANERQTASTLDKGHGRVERRTATTTTALNAYLGDWPKLAQVVRVERERRVTTRTSSAILPRFVPRYPLFKGC